MKNINPAVRRRCSATGFSLNSEVQMVLNGGIQGFIQKPFSAKRLIEAMTKILQS